MRLGLLQIGGLALQISTGSSTLAIEVLCEECGQSLRAAESHIGKKARCPKCGAAMLIKAPDGEAKQAAKPTASKESSANGAGQWFVRADDDEFGPVEKAELDAWAKQGRLDAACHVRCESWALDQWKSATAVYPELGDPAASDAPDSDDEFKLSPLEGEQGQSQQAAPAADEGGMFAGLEVESPDLSGASDLSELANLDLGGGKSQDSGGILESGSQPVLDADEIDAAQPGALDEALTEQPAAAAAARISPSKKPGGSSGGLSTIADTADEMQASIQTVAFLTLGGCALAVIVGVFWIARSAPEGIWPFTVAGGSLIIVAATAGLAAKNLLAYYKRIDAFAETEGSKELARQMSATKKFWKSAVITTIAAVALSIVSLLAFAFVPVESKPNSKKKDDEASRHVPVLEISRC